MDNKYASGTYYQASPIPSPYEHILKLIDIFTNYDITNND